MQCIKNRHPGVSGYKFSKGNIETDRVFRDGLYSDDSVKSPLVDLNERAEQRRTRNSISYSDLVTAI